jgi:uncharacterized membrane protein
LIPDVYPIVKLVHILSATLLFGTGLGSAFHFWRAHMTNDARTIAAAAKTTVQADWSFTTPAVIVQPLTGWLLMQQLGLPWSTPWILAALLLYIIAGACWLPVVWIQIQLRDLALASIAKGEPLPPLYSRYFRAWFRLGWPAFGAVLIAFYLMTAKPLLW